MAAEQHRNGGLLTAEGKKTLRANLDAESSADKSLLLRGAFADFKVWALGLIDLCVLLRLYATSFWLPSILRDTVSRTRTTSVGTGGAECAGLVDHTYCGASSDRLRERRRHIAPRHVCHRASDTLRTGCALYARGGGGVLHQLPGNPHCGRDAKLEARLSALVLASNQMIVEDLARRILPEAPIEGFRRAIQLGLRARISVFGKGHVLIVNQDWSTHA
nr:allantoate permease family MFS transporter [Burkholderia gladioli]